jgi:eukaryotic-like serine/threonine-protein kinase
MEKICFSGILSVICLFVFAACMPLTPPVTRNSGDILWSFQTEGAVWGSPLIFKKAIYVGSDDFQLYALNKNSGEAIWTFKTNGAIRSKPAVVQTASGDLLIFTSDDGYLYALEIANGKQMWRTHIGNETEWETREKIGGETSPLGYDYLQSSPVFDNGRIFIGSSDGNIYSLQADNGQVVWKYPTETKVRATPTIADGIVYIGSWDKSMYALDAETGTLRWEVPIGGQVQTSALVHDNMVYTASRKASVVALDIATGLLIWEFSYGRNMWVESSPVLVETTLYIGSSGSKVVYGLDSQTGEVRLRHSILAFCWSTPVVRKDSLFIGCANYGSGRNGFMAFDITPHQKSEKMLALADKWEHPMSDGKDICGNWRGVASSPQYADEVFYYGGLDGKVYAVVE